MVSEFGRSNSQSYSRGKERACQGMDHHLGDVLDVLSFAHIS